MSGITHSWNGTVLTITTDAGTSSVDLKGDTGCRGPQGPAGVIYDAEGNVVLVGYATEEYVDDKIEGINLSSYATLTYVNSAVANAKPDMTGYATETYVIEKVAEVASGGSIDLSDYATKNYVDSAVENVEIDTSQFATKEYVDNAVGSGGGSADLSNYYTKAEIDAMFDAFGVSAEEVLY